MNHVRILQDSFEFRETVTSHVTVEQPLFECHEPQFSYSGSNSESLEFLSSRFWAGGL